MGHILRDRFWKLIMVAFVVGLYFLGFAIISNRDVPILSTLEAMPHVEWKLSPEMTTPEEVVAFVNTRGLHSFQIITDVHQGGWHFHVIYE
jgi:hypothetical protein